MPGPAHPASPSISALLESADAGDTGASEALFAALYSELHRLARRELARTGLAVPVSATTLLHDAYLDVCGRGRSFVDRARFMGYAARVMRGLIIDYARRNQALKRGGGFAITAIAGEVAAPVADGSALARIGDALDELARVDAELARIVDLKYFCGFSFAEIASTFGVSERTVQRSWQKARVFLHRAISETEA